MIIAASQKDVLDKLEEAQLEMDKILSKKKAEYQAQVAAELRSKVNLRGERKLWWDKMNKAKSEADIKLKAESRGCKAIVEQLNLKHSRHVDRLKLKISDKEAEMDEMRKSLNEEKEIAHQQKMLRRETQQKASDLKAECVENIKAMDIWLMDMAEELRVYLYLFSLDCNGICLFYFGTHAIILCTSSYSNIGDNTSCP